MLPVAQDEGTAPLLAVGVVGTASKASRTRILVEAVLGAACGDGRGDSRTFVLGELELPVADGTPSDRRTGSVRELLDTLDAADVVVIGTPVYRAAMSGLTKSLLDLVPRGQYDGPTAPLRAKPVAVVMTAAAKEHFLAAEGLVGMLHGFFAAHVVPPTLFASHAEVTSDGEIDEELMGRARTTGRALAELHAALAHAPALRAARPQV